MYLRNYGVAIHNGYFYKAKEIVIVANMNELSTKGHFVLSRFVEYPVDEQFSTNSDLLNEMKRGDKVEIAIQHLGDEDDFEMTDINEEVNQGLGNNYYWGTFYISNVSSTDTEITVEIEDYILFLKNPALAYRLKKSKTADLVNISYGPGSKKYTEDLIKTIADGIKDEFKEVDVKLYPKTLKIPLQKYKIENLTWSQILDKLRKDYLIKTTFYDNTLYLYLPYEKASSELNGSDQFIISDTTYTWQQFFFAFYWSYKKEEVNEENLIYYQPIIDYDLDYYKSGDIETQVKGKNYKKDGTLEEYEYPTGTGFDRTIDVAYYNLSKSEFENNVEEAQKRFNINGFEGSFTTFGSLPDDRELRWEHNIDKNIDRPLKNRYLFLGDRVTLVSPYAFSVKYDQIKLTSDEIKNDQYLIESIEYSYGPNGIRQNITLGKKIVD